MRYSTEYRKNNSLQIQKKHQHFPAQTPTQIGAAPFEKIKIRTHDRNAFQRWDKHVDY